MKTLYLECTMGAAGDMLMAALYELLDEAQREDFLNTMNALGLHGVEVSPVAAKTSGITGTHMQVLVHGREEHHHEHHHEHGQAHHHHATPGHIAGIIDGLALPQGVKEQAKAVYHAIAQAEAQAHGCSVGEVHYHEVGALDAIADVTGVCYAMNLLAPEAVKGAAR